MHCKTITLIFVSLLLFLALQGCGGSRYVAGDGSKTLYLVNNIHAVVRDNGAYEASYANWTDPGAGHVVIPVNSIVEVEYAKKYLTILVKDSNKTIEFEYDQDRMRMSSREYIKLITATSPISLEGLSEIDRKGITDGKALMGMSKEGVKIALGYPAVHMTPSLDGNTWMYWRNRWGKRAIDFDTMGKVTNIR